MTCIVGLIKIAHDDSTKVYIGADSAGSDGYNVTIRVDKKVFKVGEFLFGCTSSFRMIQLLQFSFTPPVHHPDVDVYRYMCTDFVEGVRATLKNGGYTRINSNEETGGTFLVGYRGRLFRIDADFQVGESIDPFESVGCGSSYALGALEALRDKHPADETITQALQIAERRSGGVRGPFHIMSV